jgi:hypothetical protein
MALVGEWNTDPRRAARAVYSIGGGMVTLYLELTRTPQPLTAIDLR